MNRAWIFCLTIIILILSAFVLRSGMMDVGIGRIGGVEGMMGDCIVTDVECQCPS
jgi:hypothetical protein